MSRERILHVLKILSEQTDQEHGITLNQIKKYLDGQHIDSGCDKQLVRSDLMLILSMCEEGELPYRLEVDTGAHNEYIYRLYRPGFGLNEARMVFDSVSTSDFLSDGQKYELLSQMEGFLSKREVRKLKQRVCSRSSLMTDKALPEKLNILYSAIDEHKCLRYDFYRYNVDGKKKWIKKYRGMRPISVIWGEEHYYLLAINPQHGGSHKYRVDRMKNVERDLGEWLSLPQEILSYGQFDMFASDEKRVVTFRVHQDLMDMAMEILGPDTICVPDAEPEWSRVSAEVEISDGFYRWVLRQAEKMIVVAPDEIVQETKRKLQKMLRNYR